MSCALACAFWPRTADAQSPLSGTPISITRAAGSITIDGALTDEGWRNATKVEKWYETDPGDNSRTEGPQRRLSDLRRQILLRGDSTSTILSGAIRAPYSDRDNVAAVYRLRRRHPRHAQRWPHGRPARRQSARHSIRLGERRCEREEDSSPDFFWEAATQITEPRLDTGDAHSFSSLRYRER